MYLSINGKLVTENEAVISPFDHGYMYGLGAFETLRVYDGHPFLWNDHMERLREALQALNITYDLDNQKAWMETKRLLRRNQWRNAYIRFNISAGIGGIGLQTEAYQQPTVIIYGKPLPKDGPYNEKKLVLLQTTRNTPEGTSRIKSHHYLNSVLGKRELQHPLTEEGLFLTQEGYVSEGTVSNVFWTKNQILYTPSLSTGILNGITRQFVMMAAKQSGLIVEEGEFTVQDIASADEIFLTNSIQEIVPVSNFLDKAYPGATGMHVQALLFFYHSNRCERWSMRDE
ncbi:4-amino-4-deoxychorismate lyase [Fictibacillus macauensis ZFHKF-1]|uniref:4-amino-4-deoxychorismate lyase n=1 Tax=Fictibacillus macauensis ZFHKF-1 TaxID=1196324 RepID=I8IXF0_9BACL|nr:aminodeoxychorismate lyase [Fictibacillus macauensis]EIT84161.1 4-amino-4-deoxychorismate lyase [Fictibacillus macauensis ZFHKF-1]